MIEAPKSEYRIVEREGRLVVEKEDAPSKPATARGWQFPKLSGQRFDWLAYGQKLLAQRHKFETAPDGNALLTADQLASTVKLSARGDDLYYLTPRQQAMIGYLGLRDKSDAVIAGALGALLLLGVFGLVWMIVLLVIAFATLRGNFKSEYDAIPYQRYVPTEASAPAP